MKVKIVLILRNCSWWEGGGLNRGKELVKALSEKGRLSTLEVQISGE